MSESPVFSIGSPLQPRLPGDVVPYGRLVQRSGAHRMWFGQSRLIETQQIISFMAGMGIRIPYGSGVSLTALRHPYDAAVAANSIATLTGHPYTAGYGAAHPGFVRGLRGRPYDSPRKAAAEYADLMRRLLSGEEVAFEGEYFFHQGLEPLEGGGDVEVGLGVLRPRMAAAAGRIADVAITWLTPPAYLRSVIAPELRKGAVGRESAPRIATMVQIAVRRPGRDPVELADLCAGLHLRAPHYRAMLAEAGIGLGDGSRDSAAALVDSGVFLYGSPEEIASGLREYHAAGVQEVVLKATGPHMGEGLRPAIDDLIAVLTCLRLMDDADSGKAGKA
ncbi:LLM class flavin-dependent oxidoreductase [Nocardiopsis sp. CNT-189]|uniref:LLM class flavin-dependent oxidoreductase n=1 Tax=Nocardiopsis oceanisediminis TaxID=2816862 RepID=UPI003B39A4DC